MDGSSHRACMAMYLMQMLILMLSNGIGMRAGGTQVFYVIAIGPLGV